MMTVTEETLIGRWAKRIMKNHKLINTERGTMFQLLLE